jgi:hypothetical protein
MAGYLSAEQTQATESGLLPMRYVAQLLSLQQQVQQVVTGRVSSSFYKQLLLFRQDNLPELTAARIIAKQAFCAYAEECEKNYRGLATKSL